MAKDRGSGWFGNPNGHRMARYGISLKAGGVTGPGSNGLVPISRAEAEKVAKQLLEDKDVWENWGDVNFDIHGGTAVRRDSSGIEIIEVTPLENYMRRKEIVDAVMVHGGFQSRGDVEAWLDAGNTPYHYDRAYVDYEDLANLSNNQGLLAFTEDTEERDPKTRVFHTLTAYITYYGVGRIKFAMSLEDIGLEDI